MPAQFEYDERGSTFYFFVVAFYAIILLPATYYLWPSSAKKDKSKGKDRCRCDGCEAKEAKKKASEPFARVKKVLVFLGLLFGWVILVLLIYKVANIEMHDETYDPYTVLGIDRGASVKEITKKYRTWSKIHHPDRGGDAKMFVAISKAYQALTNEESRDNWEKYGNPDGPGATTFGIALPKWIVSKEYGTWVLLGYGIMLVVVLPTIVGIWWYNSIKYSAEQVLLDTTQLYFHMLHKTPNMILRRVIMVLAGSFEFFKAYNKDVVERPSDDKEIPLLMKELPNLGEKNKERPLCMPYSVKARAIIHAHLSRIPLSIDTLDKDRQYVLLKCPALMQEMIQVSHQLMQMVNFGRAQRAPNLDSIERMIRVMPLLVQATWETKSPLLQLPHFTEDMLRYCITKKRRVKNCQDLAQLSTDERRSLFRTMTDEQYADVSCVLKSMPRISADTRIEVQGEDDKETVTAKSFVTMYVTLTRSRLMDDADMGTTDETPTTGEGGGGDEDPLPPPTGDEEEAEEPQQATTEKQTAAGKQRKPWEKPQKKKPGAKKKPQQKQLTKKKLPLTTATAPKGEPTANAQENKGDGESPAKPSKSTSGSKRRPDDSEAEEESDGASFSGSEAEGSRDESKERKPEAAAAAKSASAWDEDDDDLVFDDSFAKKEMALETKSKITHAVHCPYFPEDKYEWWWVYLCDRKHKALIAGPVLMSTLVTTEEVELKFPAPPKSGIYTYQLCVRSDSYVDAECNKDIKLEVHEAREAPTSHPQWDFPSDDEGDGGASDNDSDEQKQRHRRHDSDASEYTEGDDDDED